VRLLLSLCVLAAFWACQPLPMVGSCRAKKKKKKFIEYTQCQVNKLCTSGCLHRSVFFFFFPAPRCGQPGQREMTWVMPEPTGLVSTLQIQDKSLCCLLPVLGTNIGTIRRLAWTPSPHPSKPSFTYYVLYNRK
jgi:hypothetical protein